MRRPAARLGAALVPAALVALPVHAPAQRRPAPPVAREFRGAWVATVANIDWPSRPGLSSARQQEELRSILDRAAQLKLNAVIFQVRPAADALYASEYEPWSEYLTGRMGEAPEPFYDPLEFAVREAHARGLELHAWFNPFRARHSSARSPVSPNHVARARPELVRQYGRSLWLDPGEEAVQEHSVRVILDVVRRYDVDGVHIDDYFYPYRERDSTGALLDFPDEASWGCYQAAGGTLTRADWRRANVDRFVERVYRAIKAEKRWVKFGVSPFGIWRPGHPPQITGFDPYEQIYADSRKWLEAGWLDYFAPQLYWPVAQAGQSYPVLLAWWAEHNPHRRHLWVGNFTSRVGSASGPSWPADELLEQIRRTRAQPGASGNIHFSVRALMRNAGGVADLLARELYREPALVPASPWLDRRAPGRPRIRLWTEDARHGELTLTWRPGGGAEEALWLVQTRAGGTWTAEVIPGWRRSHTLGGVERPLPDLVLVSAVDRAGNRGPAAAARYRPR